jgi:bla regulator protein BlaR1
MMHELANHLWQSSLFAIAAGLLTIALRGNRAKVRFWLWFSASMKFLLPFALLIHLGSRFDWAPAARQVAPASVSIAITELAVPLQDLESSPVQRDAGSDWLPTAALALWGCGFACVALMRLRGCLRIRQAVRASSRIELAARVEARSVPGILEPGVVGLWRAILLLPAGMAERLTPAQLDAILRHELCHIRRRDNLYAAIHMVVEAVFWFHPLVWWIGARLVDERERACDEEVLRLGSEPRVYAEGILSVCRMYVESPLACVSGVTGADVRKRIEAILSNRTASQLNSGRKAALALAAVAALAFPVAVGIMNVKPGKAQQARPKFEVASIKLSNDCGEPGSAPRGNGLQKKSGGGGPGPASPARVHVCGTLEDLVEDAYVVFKDGYENRNGGRLSRPPLEGGPAWIRSDMYVIDAKAEGSPGIGVMRSLMMQALLEDRFHLQIRREAKESPVYDLTGARNGPKVKPFQPGTCIPRDPNMPMRPLAEGQTPCMYFFRNGKTPALRTVDAQGTSFESFAKLLAIAVGRPVIDKTGIPGVFDFHVEFTPDSDTPFFHDMDPSAAPSKPDDAGPSIFAALQEQLGLKLESAKGSREFLIINRVERPTKN